MVNEGALIVAYLLSEAPPVKALRELVGDRVYYGTDLPEGYQPGAGPAVLFKRRGGRALLSAVLEPSMQYECYGATLSVAEETYRALCAALDGQSGPGIKQSVLEMPGEPMRDPETGWPLVMTAFKHWLSNT